MPRVTEQYTVGAAGVAVSIAFRSGRGGFRAVRAAERRQVGYGRPQREAGGGGVWLNLRHYRSTANGLLIIVEERR